MGLFPTFLNIATSTDFPTATVCPIKKDALLFSVFVISKRLDEIRKNGCLLRITSDAILGHAMPHQQYSVTVTSVSHFTAAYLNT